MEEIQPEMREMGMPIWCHHHCGKMKLLAVGLFNDILIIQGSAAELVIRKRRTSWAVEWKIIYSPSEQTKGRTIFSDQQLMAAFGAISSTEGHSEWLIQRYGGTSASQGRFIRYQNWLNIPCPGTGHDGDPSISIELTDDIKKAVWKLAWENR